MTGASPVRVSAAFAAAASGQRFRLVSEPVQRDVRGTVVFVHAFTEEMNKSRRMAARMARMLAGAGWRVVQRDLCGCGDSSGEFADAAWADWVRDVEDEVAAAAPDRPLWIWCQRAGALLAHAALMVRPNAGLLLWHPVLSGQQHLQQFLRLHAGARIVGAASAASGPTPIQQLRAGVAVEVGGYRLNPALATGLEQAAFDLPAGSSGPIVWLEVSIAEPPALSPQAERMLAQLRARGIEVETDVVRGPQFWQTVEIEDCDALLERTLARMVVDRPIAAAAHARAPSDPCLADHAP
jgi:exosortase A-associated hydrolase 2